MPPSSSVTDLITLIHQSRRLIELLYANYRHSKRISQAECLKALSDDSQRLQALVQRGIVLPLPDGYQLHPGWMNFFSQQLDTPRKVDLDYLAYCLTKANEWVAPTSLDPHSFLRLKASIMEIHEMWFRFIDQAAVGLMPKPERLKEVKEMWQQLIWEKAHAWWEIQADWDLWWIQCWADARSIEDKLEAFSSIHLPQGKDLSSLAQIQRIQQRRVADYALISKIFTNRLSGAQSLLWHETAGSTRQTRVPLSYFHQAEAKSLASKIRRRRKIDLPNDIPTVAIGNPIHTSSIIPLHELMEAFKTADKDLNSFISQHSLTSSLPPDKQREIFFQCLFQYAHVLFINPKKGKKVYWKEAETD